MSNLIVSVIADYGPLSDMAFAEVTQSIYGQLDGLDFKLKEYSVPPFDTCATGFFLAQAAINSPLGDRHLFYVNTAPRHDDETPRADAEGEKLVYLKLFNGVRIVAVNSGHSLSFVKPAIEEAHVVDVENAGSQFRSRDFYPKILGQVARGRADSLTGRAPSIPDMPENAVCLTDGYGNLKTSVDPEALEPLIGGYVSVEVAGARHFVKAGRSIFDVPDGHLCMAKGSSGWDLPDGNRVSFTEIVCRSGNAFSLFRKPRGGAKVKWGGAL